MKKQYLEDIGLPIDPEVIYLEDLGNIYITSQCGSIALGLQWDCLVLRT